MAEAQIDDVFNTAITDLTDQARRQAENAMSSGQTTLRSWNMPSPSKDDGEWTGDPLDIEGIIGAFDRVGIGIQFDGIIADAKNPGTVGDAISLKVQNDYLSVMERGFRARHCTPIRLMAMSIARRTGHGQEQGIFAGGAMAYAVNMIKSGKS